MKLWLASYPRSGNTFLRNVLFQCYGLESSTYHHETTYALEDNYDRFDLVKTHLLPTELPEQYKHLPKVYLIRDGRDAVLSMAHHKKDLIDIGSTFEDNLQEIIIAAKGTHFGGWSTNVKAWVEAADIIIRYEDLIQDPIKEVERIRAIYPLPEPDRTKLPTFHQLKEGQAQYGSGKFHNLTGEDEKTFSNKNFRKGKAGAWKEEMNDFQAHLFWNYHGTVMQQMGYLFDGSLSALDATTRFQIRKKISDESNTTSTTYKVLIDASKILGVSTDGVKRYVVELLRQLRESQVWGNKEFHFHIYLNGKIYDIEEIELFIDQPIQQGKEFYTYERLLLGVKIGIQFLLPNALYNRLSPIYRNSNMREKLLLLREKVSRDIFYHKVINKEKSDSVYTQYDLVHITLPQHISLFGNYNIPRVVTVHDVSHQTHPAFHLENNRLLAAKGFELLKQEALEVISVSKSTTHDLIEQYQLEPTKIHTIYEAANDILFRYNTNQHLLTEVLHRYNIPTNKKYLLCLSTIEPRKNIMNTIKAFLALKKEAHTHDLILVIAGKKGWFYEELFASVENTSDIYFTGYVRDRDLSALYSGALCFCYVSHYEGFGLPIIEAMRCRTPVIVGNNSSQVELIGKGGIAVDANDISAIKEAMHTMVEATNREQYAAQAWLTSFQFSWYETAKSTISVYRKCIESKKV
ncbi:MAG: glycosyltransferase [Bacteroidota bacterium]